MKYHLDHIFDWPSSSYSEYVLTSAHTEYLNDIKEFVGSKYPTKKVNYIFVPEDCGHHIGTVLNVLGGISYINDNLGLDYDYLINTEADNMFWDENKMLKMIYDMKKQNKHMIVEDHFAQCGFELCSSFPQFPHKYINISTLNIYSKSFAKTQLPLIPYDDIINFGWCGEPGTPFEAYLGMAFVKKHNIITKEEQLDYYKKNAYILDYDIKKIIHTSPDHIPEYDTTPDRFMKYGILHMPNKGSNKVGLGKEREDDTWKRIFKTIELHKDHMYEFE